MTWGYYFKKMVWGVIPILIVYLDWQVSQDNQKLTYMLIFSVISGILYPFANKIMERFGMLFAKKEFWKKDFFTSATGGSLQAILFIFCFVFAIPLTLGFSVYALVKHLAKIG
ncbi:colicin E1 (microcin) immunity protein [Enterobacter sp. BIGb0383]|uniref:colicin E1 family microcin immunity protein n=1 Tax=unclassified Enterobacter TaxID=2608935 RepID=UPI000F470A95|nr:MULTISPECIES: colicin E1 family microcin immunity protein [unclassified Enterobacter]ROP59155.1 colicin E1 (microcin) immunity protein [Enterobacter sp. BIGb0383]ROS09379.1 colicin E1 (microcin) immunity protein [Enterobacter sp. BIGb0359]